MEDIKLTHQEVGNINVGIPKSQKQRLKKHLDSNGATISCFVRRLIYEYMEAKGLNDQAQ